MSTPFSRTVFFKLMQQRQNDLERQRTNDQLLQQQTLNTSNAIEDIRNKQFERERQQAELMGQQAAIHNEQAPEFQNPVYSQAAKLAFSQRQIDDQKAAEAAETKRQNMIDQARAGVLAGGEVQERLWGEEGVRRANQREVNASHERAASLGAGSRASVARDKTAKEIFDSLKSEGADLSAKYGELLEEFKFYKNPEALAEMGRLKAAIDKNAKDLAVARLRLPGVAAGPVAPAPPAATRSTNPRQAIVDDVINGGPE